MVREIQRTLSVALTANTFRPWLSTSINKTPEAVKEEEFTALREAASGGYPPQPATGPPEFEVDRSSVIAFNHRSGLRFRVTPIKRLTVIIAQKGYKRPVRGPTYDEDDEKSVRIIPTFYEKDRKQWYAGIKVHGEGIFIDLPEHNPELHVEKDFRWNEAQYDPLFVWWHSLSHRLITGLSLDSGYSSAAIRERIYFKRLSEHSIIC
jgi:hypothetical protein